MPSGSLHERVQDLGLEDRGGRRRRSAGDRRRTLSIRLPLLAALAAAVVCAGSIAGCGAAVTAPPTTTARPEIPRQQVLERTLRTDQDLQYFLYVPGRGGAGASIFIAVHGVSRNAAEHANSFAPYAEANGVVLVAPCFGEQEFPDYQRLGRAGHGERADLALEALVDEVAALTGAARDKLYLFGFSGGAQFVHRYTMAYPGRVARVAVAAAGWYTWPDPHLDYPYGTRSPQDLPGVSFEPKRFLRVPIAVFVGGADTTSESLRENAELDRLEGSTRRARAHAWIKALRAAAGDLGIEAHVSLEEVPGIRHSFTQFMREGQLGDRVFEALFDVTPARGPRGDRRSALQPVRCVAGLWR